MSHRAVNEVVLVSGGFDSTYCAIEACAIRLTPPIGVFADYGQPYLAPEWEAAQYVADKMKLPLRRLTLPRIDGGTTGIFPDRNERIIRAALEAVPDAEAIYFGCRNPFRWFDKYGDSNGQWAKALGRLLAVDIVTPCVGLPKFLIAHSIKRSGFDLSRLYSTEGLS